ncbi:Homocysteine S-methyltransferase 1 [Hondaea fermentalgiana]|uniref:Homocysteine S-methyltransferase 1 n=1 Tax=Hondaea fermentalgiana TaxID=2315210 RepID=A0A2R5G9S2_9STRA|nr:Homocysteine S-methyltransferase 1 [Hondaea fermentalgiana]|eukprot:GBG25273.1 Homocysteine S-methyltransferase 1 [Hondaea fermentalgiana]
MPRITVLDGGMGRELHAMGAPVRQPEWSALPVMETPDLVREAHLRFAHAGAEVLTSNAYAVVPFHIGAEVFDKRGSELARKAVQLAKEAAEKFSAEAPGRPKPRVAASMPPPLGSYHLEFTKNEAEARQIWTVLLRAQADLCDQLALETLSSIAETRVGLEMCAKEGKPVWVSCSLCHDEPARLRSGETVADWVRAVYASNEEHGRCVEALLFNCSRLEIMESAVRIAASTLAELNATASTPATLRIGVYANAFCVNQMPEANTTILAMREEITPEFYAEYAKQWIAAGASIVGGCCGIGPAHIAQIAKIRDGQEQ